MSVNESIAAQKQSVEFPLEADHKHKAVRVGKWEADRIYYNYPIRENDLSLKKTILEKNGCEVNGLYPIYEGGGYRDAHRKIVPLLGSMFYSQLRAVSRKVWINPIEDTLNKYCRYWNSWKSQPHFDEGQVRRTWKYLNLIRQLEEDGMSHLAPIVIYFMDTPSALKRDLGKSTWKKLANSSLSFNKCLVRYLIRIEGEYKNSNPSKRIQRIMWRRFEELRDDLAFLVSLKKTFVRRYTSYPLDLGEGYYDDRKAGLVRSPESKKLMQWLNKHARVSNCGEVNQFAVMYRDTMRLCKNLGREFKVVSPRKMKDYHDKLSRESRMLRRTELMKVVDSVNKGMEWLQPYCDEVGSRIKNPKVTFEIIKDYERLLDESEEMEHCVADYEYLITDQEYIVVAMKSEVQRTTLGIYLDYMDYESRRFEIEQHYGYENEMLRCEESMKLAKIIVGICNDVYRKLQNKKAA